MNYDYEADLNRLKEQQKQAAIADLDKQKNQSLSDLNAEEATIKPTYYNLIKLIPYIIQYTTSQ